MTMKPARSPKKKRLSNPSSAEAGKAEKSEAGIKTDRRSETNPLLVSLLIRPFLPRIKPSKPIMAITPRDE